MRNFSCVVIICKEVARCFSCSKFHNYNSINLALICHDDESSQNVRANFHKSSMSCSRRMRNGLNIGSVTAKDLLKVASFPKLAY